jgi:hypothetical protein
MNLAFDTLLVSSGAIATYIATKIYNRKPKHPTIEDAAYPFQVITDVRCPMCKLLLNYRKVAVYCECEEYHKPHFHFACETNSGIGCKFKWIMRTASK